MDHIMNNRLSLEFGQPYARIPLAKSPHIVHGDTLDIDWTAREQSRPINGMGRLMTGPKPINGGYCIFTAEERAAFLEKEPNATPLLRPFVGAREYLQDGERWILALHDAARAGPHWNWRRPRRSIM